MSIDASTFSGVSASERELLERLPDAVFVADADGRCLWCNTHAVELLGWSVDALRRMTVRDLVAPESRERQELDLQRVCSEVLVRRERLLRRTDGTSIPVELSGARLPDGRLIGTVRDTSERAPMLTVLQRLVGLHRAILEATTDGVSVTDVRGRLIAHNQQFVRMWRIPQDMVERGRTHEMVAHARRQMKDPADYLRYIRESRRDFDRTRYTVLEFRDGRAIERWSYPMREDGRFSGRVTVYRDITESYRQSQELRSSQLQFLQAQKMEAVGRLAGGVAHDFNNMLTAILGHADLLARTLPDGDARREAVEQIQLAAERSARLTRELLTFSRRQPAQEQVVEVVALLERVRPLLVTLLGDRVELVMRQTTSDSWVVADSSWIEQALLNLAINARDAMHGEGRLTLAVSEEDVLARDLAARGAGQAGPHVVLSVSDTGHGISPEVRPHLFEPFFTTKEPGKGTGLGLASVYGIIQQCGGFIEVLSEPGRGATFRLLLPRTTLRPGPLGSDTDERPAHRVARGSVLVVEDEGAVRTLVETLLRREGFDVHAAVSGDEALAMLDRLGTLDVLLSDLMMPGLRGSELATRVLDRRPGVGVVLMSGYPGDLLARESGELPWPVLLKPFTREQLVSSVREALGRR